MDNLMNVTTVATAGGHKRSGTEIVTDREKVHKRPTFALSSLNLQNSCQKHNNLFGQNNNTADKVSQNTFSNENEYILALTKTTLEKRAKDNSINNNVTFANQREQNQNGSSSAATNSGSAAVVDASNTCANTNGATTNSSYPVPPSTTATPTINMPIPQEPMVNANHATALAKIKDRKEQKIWEKTRGDRKKETELFVKEKLAESHLEKIIKDELLDLAIQILKTNNLLENKQRNLLKFEKAKNINPDLPFIPKSASNFQLNSSDAIKGTKKFDELQQHCKLVTEKYNKEISNLCYQVGLLEKQALVTNRTTTLLKKGLTLSYAMQIHCIHKYQLHTPEKPKKTAALALLGCILSSDELLDFVATSEENLRVMIEYNFQNFHGNLDLKSFQRQMCENDKKIIQAVIHELTECLCLVTVHTWKHLILKQDERRRQMEMMVSMEELKVNSATEATEKLLEKEENVSHRVLTDLINTKIEEKLKHEKKKIKNQIQKNSLGERKNHPFKAQKTGLNLKKKKLVRF